MNVLTKSFGALLVCFLTLHAVPALAAWNVAIGDTSTHGAWSGGSPDVWTPSASGATVAASEIASRLGSGPVSIVTGSTGTESGDIAVNTPVAWTANTLSLAAAGAVKVGAVMAASGSANLTVTGQFAVNISDAGFSGQVDFSGSGALTVNGGTYTVIHDITALQNLVPSDANRRYALGSQIDAAATSGWNGGAGFAPVGPFWGTLDGLGHSITGLTINRPTTDNVGLFSGLVGTVRNVALSTASVTGKDYVGLLVGQHAGQILSVHASGNVSGVSHVGGLVGLSQEAIADAYTTGDVIGSGSYIGGLVGTNYMPVNRCGSSSTVTGNAKQATGEHLYIGGLIGWNNGSAAGSEIRNSHGNGHVVVNVVETGGTKGFFAGGLVGWNDGTSGMAEIIESYSVARVQGPAIFGPNYWRYGGGLVGLNDGQHAAVRRSYASVAVWGVRSGGGLSGWNRDQALIEDAWAWGSVDKASGDVYYGGGLAAFNSGGANIRRAYSLVKVAASTRAGGAVTGNGIYQSESSGLLSDNSGVIEDVHVAGPGITGVSNGGIATWNYTSNGIIDAYWDTESTGTATGVKFGSGSAINMVGLTSAQAHSQANYTGFDFTNHWVMTEGVTRPLLRNVVTANQTISISTPSVLIGGTDTLVATGGASENPIVFASLTPSVCTVSGATVSGVSGGTCTVSANQAGNANNNPAPQATLSFAISSIAANGTCGSAHATTPLVTSAPSGGALCTHSTASSVTTNPSTFAWTCAGSSTTASCSASRGYTVTSSAGANGSVSDAQVVAQNAQPEFTATPDGGYAVNAWAGTCGGSASGTGNVNYTAAAVTADCMVSVSFSGNASTPAAFAFTPVNNVAQSAVQTSNIITVAGITTGADISISGGEYQIGSGGFVSTPGSVNNGDTVTVRHTSSAAHSTATTTTLTIGGVSAAYVSTTLAAPVVNGSCGSSHSTTLITTAPSTSLCTTGSATSVTTGVNAYNWSCTGSGSGSTANCSASRGYTVTPSAGANGSLSPSTAQVVAYNATPVFTVTPDSGHAMGSVSGCSGSLSGSTYTSAAVTADCTVTASFSLTPDTTPDAFSFTATGNAALSTVQTSGSVIVAGINTAAAISVTDGQYQIDTNGWTSTAGSVNNGGTVAVRHTSSAAHSTVTTTTLTIGGVSAAYVSTTVAVTAVNGSCGTSHSATLVTTAPSTNLCTTGSATSMTNGVNAYTWSCIGSGGGSTANCSASRGYNVTPSAGANGSISPNTAQVVAYNATPSFAATPDGGYAVNVWGGTCGGSVSGTGNVNYTTAAVTADCAVSVSFSGNASTPQAFAFTPANSVALSTVQTSDTITVAGITTGAAISITGGEYRINSGSFVSAAGTVNNGDTVTVRHTSSAAYTTTTTTTLTIGGVSADYVSTTVAPPPPPAPEPPPPPPVVEQGSNHTLSGGPFEVRVNAVNGTVLTITGPTSLQLANGGGLLQAQPEPTGATARLTFVAGPGGVPVPRLLQGRARFKATAPGQPVLGWLQSVPPASSVVLNAGACTGTPTELLAEVNETTGQTLITVLGCQVALPSGLPRPASTRSASSAKQARAAKAETAAATTATVTTTATTAVLAILPGEYVVLNAQGQIQEMGLGSATGDQDLTGDAVARTGVPGLVWMHSRPMLNGSSERLGGNVAQAAVNWLTRHQLFSEFFIGGENGLLIAKQGEKRVVLGALGRVSVDPDTTQPDSWLTQGQATYTLRLQGLSMDWAPAIADTEGFARLLNEHGGSTVVQADGTLLVTLNTSGNGNTHFAVQAGEQLESPTDAGGLAQTPQGVLTYTSNHFGYPQALYPAAADFAGLRAAVLAADPAGSALGQGQGRIKLVLGGQTYTLKPDMALVPLPAQHVGKTVWLDGQPVRLFMPVASLPGFAQGFGVE